MSDQVQSENPIEPDAPHISIELVCDPDTNVLSAIVSDAETPLAVDLSYLRDLVASHGYEEFFFENDALQTLLDQIKDGGRGTYAIGERRDAKVTIVIADDAMRAVAHTEPAYGGTRLSIEQVQEALINAGVDQSRWDQEALQALITKESVVDHEIATGRLPENGINSRFVSLVEGVVRRAPTQDERGNVDQYDIFDFVVVEPGTLLMRREPATPGVNGADVRGNVLPATPGTDADFAKDMHGVAPHETDGNLLIAATNGHPIVLTNGVRLDDVLKLSSADMRTGHVDFDGSIIISGDVSAGVSLVATGDVTIKGTVEDASIQAGADIIIAGGVIHADPQDDEQTQSMRLEAGGNIQAKFASGAYLHAKGDVIVKEYIGFCRTEAGQAVLVGQSGGKGRVYGGSCHGRNGVFVNRLGINSSAATLIIAGLTASPDEDQTELNDALASLEAQGKKVQYLLENLRCNLASTPEPGEQAASGEEEPVALPDEETCRRLNNTMEVIQGQQAELRQSLVDLLAQTGACTNASIYAAKSVRAGVSMRINGVQRRFDNRDAGGTFKVREGAVVRVE